MRFLLVLPVLERLAKVEREKGVRADLTLLVGGSNVNPYFVNEFKKKKINRES